MLRVGRVADQRHVVGRNPDHDAIAQACPPSVRIASLPDRIKLNGKPKCGKSFWLFDCLMHVALNWEYRGRRVHHGPVVYCAFEGQSGLEARVEAFRLARLEDYSGSIPFYLQPVTLNLVKDNRALIKVIRDTLGDTPPVAVALDTLNRSLPGSESSDQDMSAYVQAADAIREEFECAVPIVHHCGIDGTRPRGHTAIRLQRRNHESNL